MPSLRAALDRYQLDNFTHLQTSLRCALPSLAAAASGPSAALLAGLPTMLLYPPHLYAFGLSSLAAQARNAASSAASPLGEEKNASLAELRVKAKQHAAQLGLT